MQRIDVRALARDCALRVLSMGRRIDGSSGWVRFPYYHHVHDHERSSFVRQLDYLRQFGDFISLDDALTAISGQGRIKDRLFSLGFDDGFASCARNALPILAERAVPATFYVVTGFVGSSLEAEDVVARTVFGHESSEPLAFLSWDDCRTMIAHGMTIGSHTHSHPRLAACAPATVTLELTRSKVMIEGETGVPCRHFCAPYGLAGRDFDSERDPALAREAGYASFATGTRGGNRVGADAYTLKRDHLVATWGIHQLRYFFAA